MDIIYEQPKDTALKIRKALKDNFPEYKASHFKVRTSTYSGGSSISVGWEDNPTQKAVEQVISTYSSASFDGMTDYESVNGYKDPEDGKLYSGAKYIMASREISDKRKEVVIDYLEETHEDFSRGDERHSDWLRRYDEVLDYFDDNNELKSEYQASEPKGKKSKDNLVDMIRYKETKKKDDVRLTTREVQLVSNLMLAQSEKEGVKLRDIRSRVSTEFLMELKRLCKTEEEFLEGVQKQMDNESKVETKPKEDREKENTEEKEIAFNTNRGLSLDVMNHLLKGEVTLVFTKANGAERTMRATRNVTYFSEHSGLVSAFTEGNQSKNVGKELNSGTINVIDLDIEGGGARKFVVERLISYHPEGDFKRVISKGKKEESEEGNEEGTDKEDEEKKKHFDPTKLGTGNMIKILGKKVVRLVFKKKDGSLRPMIATRNPNVVELYTQLDKNGKRPTNNISKEQQNDVQVQIDKDYVKVLDLEKMEFRTFKPSNLVEYDEDLSIASWIEFTENSDAWYNIAMNGSDPREYYQEGKRNAVNMGKELPERLKYEREQKERLKDEALARETMEKASDQADKSRNESEYKKKRLLKVNNMVNEYVKGIPDTSKTDSYHKLFEEMETISTKLEDDKSFNNMENKVDKVQKKAEDELILIKVWSDFIFLHPTFIINGYSGRVYVDNTPDKIFSDIGTVYGSDADTGSEDVLAGYESKVKKVGKLKTDQGVSGTGEQDVRMERILKLASDEKKDLAKEGITVSEQYVKGIKATVLSVLIGGKVYLVHSDMVLHVDKGKAYIAFKCENKNARVKEYKEFLSSWIGSANTPKEQESIKRIAKLILRGIDLRTRVSLENK